MALKLQRPYSTVALKCKTYQQITERKDILMTIKNKQTNKQIIKKIKHSILEIKTKWSNN